MTGRIRHARVSQVERSANALHQSFLVVSQLPPMRPGLARGKHLINNRFTGVKHPLPAGALGGYKSSMPKGKAPRGHFERLDQQVGFRVTSAQLEWLHQASVKAKAVSLSEWLRKLATDAGGSLVDVPFPEREFIPPEDPARKKPR